MKLSYEWLKEYVDIDVSGEELAHGLTMAGTEVGAIEDVDGDRVMDLEITSNRPDCLNIIGLAREASAVFDKDLRLPEMKIPERALGEKGPPIKCLVQNRKLCPRYTARVITDVHIKEASERIERRILALGLRAVNNVVDVTNFCLMETGQPLHAFDLDRIRGGKVIVREAARGEKLVTIDGVERELEPGMPVIADAAGPIAIAGVMGGKTTEVTGSTKNILLESAYFDPISIRRAARALGLSSDSSYRFERGADKGMTLAASDRAARLIYEEAGGKICELYDVGVLAPEEVSIEFDTGKAENLLGISLEPEKVKRIFRRLGMTVSGEKGAKMVVGVPSFREDIRKEVDLIEEVARIHGYDNIPATITRFVPQVKRKERSRRVEEKLREMLPALGLNEIMAYSLISEAAVKRFAAITAYPVALRNPLSEDQKILTPQLLDGMLRAVSWNINRKNTDLGLFEVGKIYSRVRGAFLEVPAVCVGLTGDLRKNWQEGRRPANLYDLKGIVETVLRGLKLSAVFREAPVEGLANCAGIFLPGGKESIGFLGEASSRLLSEYGISQPVYICQVKLDAIMENAVLENRYLSVSRFPTSVRDVSILCDRSLSAGEIRAVIEETGEEIIRGIDLLDVYEGERIPGGKKSLTYSIEYGLESRTLTDEEIEAIHSRVKDGLVKELKVSFR